jgi:hypothetical protein
VRDREIDNILKRAAEALPQVHPAVVDRAAAAVASRAGAVRPVPPPWVWKCGLFLIWVLVAAGGGIALGLHGIAKMSALESVTIFAELGILTWLAVGACVTEITPGSRRIVAPWILGLAGCAALAAVFALLFSDYAMERFVAHGMTCLTAGLLFAVPVWIAAAWMLHRGFPVNPAASGTAKGILAGLAGVAMLELHCGNLEAPHVMVWHTGVLIISVAAGAVLGATVGRPRWS